MSNTGPKGSPLQEGQRVKFDYDEDVEVPYGVVKKCWYVSSDWMADVEWDDGMVTTEFATNLLLVSVHEDLAKQAEGGARYKDCEPRNRPAL